MKTSELSIKDWVIDSTGEYVRIDGVGCSDYNELNRKYNIPIRVYDEDDRYLGIINPTQKRTYNEHMEKIKPIPITDEILKANGFEFGLTTEQEDFCAMHASSGVSAEKSWVNEDGGSEYSISWLDGYVSVSNLKDSRYDGKCMYVHELQHALRLCGLTELADNFVVV